MSTTLDEALAAANATATDAHIVIQEDRSVVVPAELRQIGVLCDHNVNVLSFDCPRYWKDGDLNEMDIYINAKKPDGTPIGITCENIAVDAEDESIIHFDWIIRGDITDQSGKLTFLVCARQFGDTGLDNYRWHSMLCTDLSVAAGIPCVLPDSDTPGGSAVPGRAASSIDALEALAESDIITPMYHDGTFYTDDDGAVYVL